MAESLYSQHGDVVNWTADAAYSAGDIIQLPDGRAGQVTVDCASGALVGVRVRGIVNGVPKTTLINVLDGGRVFWDHSANKGHFRKVNDRDFYVGRQVGDAGPTDTLTVALNVNPADDIDALAGEGGYLSVATGTAAAGGFGLPQQFGKSRGLSLTNTSEVQCVDILSVDKFDKGANAIVEAVVRPAANGSSNAVDFNVGIANGTSTSDFDATTEHVAFHVDGGSTAINAQSKDGTTTVAATDTTKTISAGSAVANRTEFWIDTRDPANVKLYVDGIRVLSGLTFKIDAATGPFGIIAHLEKTTGTATAGPIYIDRLAARFQQ